MTTDMDELKAALADMQAALADAPEDMRAILEQQINAVRDTLRLAAAVTPVAREPLQLTEDEQRFFAVRAPAPLPDWLPDDLRHGSLSEDMLRCPDSASVYETEHSLGCAISTDGTGIPSPHGLTLGFHPGGGLAYQRFYEHGLLRWAIDYYITGARESAGNYCDREPKVHLEDGLQTRWSPGGQVVAQTTYRAGVREGWSFLWEDDGQPIMASLYRDGVVYNEVRPGYVDVGR